MKTSRGKPFEHAPPAPGASPAAARPPAPGRPARKICGSIRCAKSLASTSQSLPLLARELAALVERERHARLGLDEQVVLREEAREQQAMPVLVGALAGEPVDALRALLLVEPVAELAAMRAQAVAQLALVGRERGPRLVVAHGELLDGLPRAGLGDAAGLLHGVLEILCGGCDRAMPSGFLSSRERGHP